MRRGRREEADERRQDGTGGEDNAAVISFHSAREGQLKVVMGRQAQLTMLVHHLPPPLVIRRLVDDSVPAALSINNHHHRDH